MEHINGIISYVSKNIEVLKWIIPLIGGLITGMFTVIVPKKVEDTLFEKLYITGQRVYYLRLIVGMLAFSFIPIVILWIELGNDTLIKNLPILIILNLDYLLMLVLFYENILSVRGSFFIEDEQKNKWFFEKYNESKDIFYMKSKDDNLSHSFKSKKFEDVIGFVQHQYNYEDTRFYIICNYYNELSQSIFKKYRTQGWYLSIHSIFFYL
ncbi:hypothetical protein [Mammaliicoccus stepanovicii]|uniref:Uncharacterized protein n=1 Tax=Mammaliicoccus stepanovicii TaxID=643214 RepID=A0A0K2JN12_9STAP|nr:hypothetical protein [Mammaliicoccus stepanovicii]ALB00606.1 hypothetical protein [Mammaliicoccus stepanovicii]PNZ79370.1 hypothetical protein CD111_00065 [Mammaliicoccus stepanovicii]GGI42969.1 hypothetical protein GCM10010896_21070 [Mammaliicoccus stepanovicii]SNV51689.1 Uncharacterised protein [Mammaliicoccus stepanovicii]